MFIIYVRGRENLTLLTENYIPTCSTDKIYILPSSADKSYHSPAKYHTRQLPNLEGMSGGRRQKKENNWPPPFHTKKKLHTPSFQPTEKLLNPCSPSFSPPPHIGNENPLTLLWPNPTRTPGPAQIPSGPLACDSREMWDYANQLLDLKKTSKSCVGQKVRELSYDLTTLRGSGLAQNLRMSGSHIPVKSYNNLSFSMHV